MKIVLINAAAPEYLWKKRYTPKDFEAAQEAWTNCPIKEEKTSPAKTEGYHIWIAPSLHARQTAERLTGEGNSGTRDETALLTEIPLMPYTEEEREVPLWKYYLHGHFQWKRGDPRQPEGYAASFEKGEELLDLLEERGEDAVLISHERRILLLLDVLRKRKYQIRRGSVIRLSPMERILAAKKILTCGGCMHNCQLTNPGCGIGKDKAKRYGVRKDPDKTEE